MKKIFILFFLLSFLFACNKTRKEYHPNGKLKIEKHKIGEGLYKIKEYTEKGELSSILYENKDGNLDSIATFFENGKKVSSVSYRNGAKLGDAKWFYPSGQVQESVFLKKGKRCGEHKYYTRTGRLKRIVYYKIINESSHLNGIKRFNNKGDIIIDSSEFVDMCIKKEDDTKISVNFNIYMNKEYQKRAIYASYDKSFEIKDKTQLKQLDIHLSNELNLTEIKEDTIRVLFEFRKEVKKDSFVYGKIFLEKDLSSLKR